MPPSQRVRDSCCIAKYRPETLLASDYRPVNSVHLRNYFIRLHEQRVVAVVLEAAMKRDDAGYYRRRALQEQQAAQKATCSAARQRHDELAMVYRFRAAMLTTGPGAWLEERRTTATVND